MGEYNTLSAERLIDRLMTVFAEDNDLQTTKNKIAIILYDYEITPKTKEIVPYHESKNEVLIKRFAMAKAVAGCSPRTVSGYVGELRRFFGRVGIDADVVRSEDIQVYIARLLTDGNSKSYCDTVRRYLSSFYSYLHREDIIAKNPMNRVEAIKFRREKESAFTDLEVEKMRVACKTSMETAILEMLLSTGCRASELCSIKIRDIDHGEISIQGKGGKWRTVFMNAKAEVAVETFLAERNDKNEYLFPAGSFNKSRGNPRWFQQSDSVSPDQHYGRESINTMCRRIAKRAGVQGAHAHRFRRTCATHALRRGMPIEMVSMMLGHEQLTTTQIYLDVRESDLKIAHEKYVF